MQKLENTEQGERTEQEQCAGGGQRCGWRLSNPPATRLQGDVGREAPGELKATWDCDQIGSTVGQEWKVWRRGEEEAVLWPRALWLPSRVVLLHVSPPASTFDKRGCVRRLIILCKFYCIFSGHPER